jgi:hypothetical protein
VDGNFWVNICHIPYFITFSGNVYAYYPTELPDKKMDRQPAGEKQESIEQ